MSTWHSHVQSRPGGIHMSSWHSNVQLAFKCPVASRGIHMSSWHSNVQWRQSRPVAPGGARLHLVAVRSHFGLRLDGRNNPARASNRPGRRIMYNYKFSSPLPPVRFLTCAHVRRLTCAFPHDVRSLLFCGIIGDVCCASACTTRAHLSDATIAVRLFPRHRNPRTCRHA